MLSAKRFKVYLKNWADNNDSEESHGQSPATFAEWLLLKEQGFQPEEDYVVIGSFGGRSYGVNNNDIIKTPHLHIVDQDKKDIACVGLTEPVYCPHDDETCALDDDGKDELTELFSSVVEYPKFREAGITIWDYACLTWNYNNDTQIQGEIKIPDYNKL